MPCVRAQAAVLVAIFALVAIFCSSPVAAVSLCPPLWIPWGSSCYRLTGQTASWDEGHATCHDWGAVIAAPHSEQENKFIATTAMDAGLGWVWVGCKFIDRAWRCEGQVVGQAYSNWSPGEPMVNDGDNPGRDICAYAGISTQKWNDVPCTDRPKAMCVLRSRALIQHHSFSGDNGQQQQLNRCLLGHVIREYITKSASRCASACLKEPGCRSFNVKKTEQDQKLCQLSNATRAEDPENFLPLNTHCIYYAA